MQLSAAVCTWKSWKPVIRQVNCLDLLAAPVDPGRRKRFQYISNNMTAYAASQVGNEDYNTHKPIASGLCRPKFQQQYGQRIFGDLDGTVINFPKGVTTRPFQRIILYCAAQSVLLRKKRVDLSSDFQVSRVLRRPSSPFDEDEKQRIGDWVQQSMPEDCILD